MQPTLLILVSRYSPDCASPTGELGRGVYHSIERPKKSIMEFIVLHNQAGIPREYFRQLIERLAHSMISAVSLSDKSGDRFTILAPSYRSVCPWTGRGGDKRLHPAFRS